MKLTKSKRTICWTIVVALLFLPTTVGCVGNLRHAWVPPLLENDGAVASFNAGDQPVTYLAMSKDGKCLATGLEGVTDGGLRLGVPGTDIGVNLTKGEKPRQLKIWELGKVLPREIVSTEMADRPFQCACFGEDGVSVRIPVGDASLATYKLDGEETGAKVNMDGLLALSPDGRFALRKLGLGGWDVVDLETKRPVFEIPGEERDASDMPAADGFLFSPNGEFLMHMLPSYFMTAAMGHGNYAGVRIYDIRTGSLVSHVQHGDADQIAAHGVWSREIQTCHFSPNGTFFAIIGSRDFGIYRTLDGSLVSMKHVSDDIDDIAFSGDERFVATAYQRYEMIDERELEEMESISVIDVHPLMSDQTVAEFTTDDPIRSIIFSSDPTTLHSGHNSGKVRTWKIEPTP